MLILDDAFAELDEVRRERLAERVKDADQLFITAAVESDVPETSGSHLRGGSGEVGARE